MKNYYLPIGKKVRFKIKDKIVSGEIIEIRFEVFNPLKNIYLIKDDDKVTYQMSIEHIISNETDEPYIPKPLLSRIEKMEEIYFGTELMSFDIENVLFDFGCKELKLGQCYFLKDYIQIGKVKSIIVITKENPKSNLLKTFINALQFGYYVENSKGEELFLQNVYFTKAEIVKELAKINK